MVNLLYKVLFVLCASRIIHSKIINYATYCPSGYYHIPNSSACVLVTTNATAFNNLCLHSGQSQTNIYDQFFDRQILTQLTEYLQLRNVHSIWLPIRKNLQKLLVWKLPIHSWNTRIEMVNSTNAPKNYEQGDCVLYLVDDNKLIMENCGTLHHHLCMHSQNETNYVFSNLCGERTITSRLSKLHGICFAIEELNSPAANNKTSIAFIDSDDKLVAVDRFIELNNRTMDKMQIATNFISSVPPGYVTVMENGAIELVDKKITEYRVTEKNLADRIQNFHVTIHISYDPDRNVLIANVRNYQFLWTHYVEEYFGSFVHKPIRCFSDTVREVDFFEEMGITESKIGPNLHFTIDLIRDDGIENYWCEAQKLLTFKTVESNRLTVVHKEKQVKTYIFCVYANNICRDCNLYKVFELFETIKSRYNEQPSHGDYVQPPRRQRTTKALQLPNEPRKFIQVQIQNVELKKILSIHNEIVSQILHVYIKRPLEPIDNPDDFKLYQEQIRLPNYNITQVRAIDMCFSQDLKYFSNARLNEISVFKLFCLMDTGLPPVQKCIGNELDGAYWERVYNTSIILGNCDTSRMNEQAEVLFILNQDLRNRTLNITNDEAENIVERILSAVNAAITAGDEKSTEVQYAAITLNNLIANSNIDLFKTMDAGSSLSRLDTITEILDTLLDKETHSLVEDPNRILSTIDALALQYAESHVANQSFLNSDDGVILIQKSNVILMIVDPAIKNISGIALYKKNKSEIDLNDFSVRKLQGHEKAVNIYNKSLEISAQIPTEWLSKIQIDQNGHMMAPNRIIFKIYYRHSLFDEAHVDPNSGEITETIETDSKIVSISVSNYTGYEATHGLFAMFRTKGQLRRTKPVSRGCSDFSATTDPFTKNWNRDLTKYEKLDDSIIVCPIKHLSNVGFVKLFGNKIATDKQTRILILISHYSTVIGCILSTFGLMMIFLTAILFDKWQRREATPLVLNISAATFLQIVVFAVAELQIFTNSVYCLMVGGLLHYFTLVTLFISLFIADSQYRRYIILVGPAVTDHFKMKIFFVGWFIPFLTVVGCIIIQSDSYIPSEEFHDLGGICYPTNIILQCFVHFPVVATFCANSAVYIWIMVRLTREDTSLRKTPRKTIIWLQIRLFFFIFMVLSLPWIFGLLAHYTELYLFAILFNLLAPMQGFCLFVFCCLVDTQTRKFWLKCKYFKKP